VRIVAPPREKFWASKSALFAPAHLNAYVANGAVIAGRFGNPERDELARLALRHAFPGREVRMTAINHIAAGGGHSMFNPPGCLASLEQWVRPRTIVEVPELIVLAGRRSTAAHSTNFLYIHRRPSRRRHICPWTRRPVIDRRGMMTVQRCQTSAMAGLGFISKIWRYG
jgi:hypothetical protein